MDTELDQILNQLENLLRRTHCYRWANEIERVITELPNNKDEYLSYLAGSHVWGSSGSLFDLILSEDNGHVSDDFRRDNRQLSELLLRLMASLRANGYDKSVFYTAEAFLKDSIERSLA
jgi:hypothetical protein